MKRAQRIITAKRRRSRWMKKSRRSCLIVTSVFITSCGIVREH